MIKTIEIDGKDISFKSTGAFLLRYKMQFRRDALADLMKLENAIDDKGELSKADGLDLEVFYNLAWTLAKTADKKVGEPLDWLDTFEEFPLMTIIPELMELLYKSIGSTESSKNLMAVVK